MEASHCDILNLVLNVTSKERVVRMVTVQIGVHKSPANCRLEDAELTVQFCVWICDVSCVPLDTVYVDIFCVWICDV
jgi:hypothetical protein